MSGNLLEMDTSKQLLAAAHQAAGTCLSATPEDRAVVIHDDSTRLIAAALAKAFTEIGAEIQVYDMDAFGDRPFTVLPSAVIKSLEKATVSVMAVTAKQGELSVRSKVLEISTTCKLRHAHMPSITPQLFEDGLSMDYREVSLFIDRIADVIKGTTSLRMTSLSGTDIEFEYASPPKMVQLDGLINAARWQNLPSGQIIIVPTNAYGRFVVDSSIGDWFNHKYDVTQYPVTIHFDRARATKISCDNQKLQRELSLYMRSSENSGRISELAIGANLGLTRSHKNSLFQAYRPGASIAAGNLHAPGLDIGWTASTFTQLIGRRTNLFVGNRQIMSKDTFTDEFL